MCVLVLHYLTHLLLADLVADYCKSHIPNYTNLFLLGRVHMRSIVS